MRLPVLLLGVLTAVNGFAEENTQPAPETQETRQSYDLFPESPLAIGTDILNQKVQHFYFSSSHLTGENFEKVGVIEQETRARGSFNSLGAFFSPVPSRIRVGVTYEQTEGFGKASATDVTDPSKPSTVYGIKFKSQEASPHLVVGAQIGDSIRMALDFSNNTVTQDTTVQSGTTKVNNEESRAYSTYRLSAALALPLGYEIGLDFTPTIRLEDDVTVHREGEVSAVIRRSLPDSVVQGKVTHTHHSAVNSEFEDTYSVSIGGERKIFDEMALGGVVRYDPAHYGKTRNLSSDNIPTLSVAAMGKFQMDKNFHLTGEVVRAKAAEVSKKVSGVEFTANSVTTGGTITLSYTGI